MHVSCMNSTRSGDFSLHVFLHFAVRRTESIGICKLVVFKASPETAEECGKHSCTDSRHAPASAVLAPLTTGCTRILSVSCTFDFLY